MSKSSISRLFLGSITAVIAGCVLGFLAVVGAYGAGAFVMDGPDVVGIQPTAFAGVMLVLFIASLLAIVAGAVAGLISWIGALLATAQLDQKLWFVILLALGVWNMGLVAMILYVVAGPDDAAEERTRRAVPSSAAQ
jgi:hypothetical protein